MLDKLKDPDFPWQKIEDAPHIALQDYFGRDNNRDYSMLWNNNTSGWCYAWNQEPCNPTHFMPLDTPEKQAQALRIAVDAIRFGANRVETSEEKHIMLDALKQIEEVLG
jgi:hypothetical protein